MPIISVPARVLPRIVHGTRMPPSYIETGNRRRAAAKCDQGPQEHLGVEIAFLPSVPFFVDVILASYGRQLAVFRSIFLLFEICLLCSWSPRAPVLGFHCVRPKWCFSSDSWPSFSWAASLECLVRAGDCKRKIVLGHRLWVINKVAINIIIYKYYKCAHPFSGCCYYCKGSYFSWRLRNPPPRRNASHWWPPHHRL